MKILKQNFFSRNTLTVAQELLGKQIIREFNGNILSGMIIETEAYMGLNDSASHSSKGKTPRNSVMFGPAGMAYIYFTYGMYYLLNIVTEKEDIPCSVLIRAVEPLQGREQMEILRKRKGKELTNGPAKLCQAMAIDKSLNGWDLTRGEKLWLEDYKTFSDKYIKTGPRIGISYAKPRDRDAPWRFWIQRECRI